MKNAADGLDPSLRLSATVSIVASPHRFGFISKLALGGTVKPGAKRADPEKMLLTVRYEASSEIHENLSKARRSTHDSESMRRLLGSFDEDDWNRSRRSPEESLPMRYYFQRRGFGETSAELTETLTSIVRESESYTAFRRMVESIIIRATGEATLAEQSPLKNKVRTFAGEEPSIPSYVQNLLRRMAEMKVLHLTERRKPIGREEAERLLSLKVRRGGSEVLRNIQETVTSLLGVQIDAFESSRRGEESAELDVDNFLVEVNGSGIREALRLVLDVEFQHPHILLVEEPEIHLHPALETSMMRYLKRISPNCQVFIATHSTNFLDTAEVKNVYLVSKPDSTQIQSLDFEEAETLIPRELGLRLSSLFMFDRLVFVEGPSDEAILREWASTLGINLSQSNVGFIAMGGARNFTHYTTGAVLSLLTRRQVKMCFLMDRDERDDAEIARLRAALGENAVVKVLEKRELENYLICPRAIGEFVRWKKTLGRNGNEAETPAEFDLRKGLEECAEKLRQEAIEKRVERIVLRPVYPSVRNVLSNADEASVTERVMAEIQKMIEQLGEEKKRVDDVYKKQSEYLDSVWQSRKLAIVPGDLLLDMVCQTHGVRFKKRQGDGAHLAALMNRDEIDEEIKAIICEIGE